MNLESGKQQLTFSNVTFSASPLADFFYSNCSKENESTISGIANAFENLNIKMPSQNVEIKIADQSSNAGFSSLMDEFCTMGGV